MPDTSETSSDCATEILRNIARNRQLSGLESLLPPIQIVTESHFRGALTLLWIDL